MKAREKPPKVPVQANYSDSVDIFKIRDVYIGAGMKGIDSSTHLAKKIRVVKLQYRIGGAGQFGGVTMGSSPSGAFAPAIFCPVSAYGASWDAKEVMGEAKIYEDGSAAFMVPARTPVYFQVLDSMGYCIASMRSWSTLMPGETFACMGCHESKVADYGMFGITQAGAPQKLDTPLGIENKPFDYKQMVQPIFDDKCVKCHTANHESGLDLSGDLLSNSGTKKSWTTSYISLLKGIGPQSSTGSFWCGALLGQI